MAALPYITSPGNISKALEGIKTASVPDTVSQDFVKTVLKIPGGSGDQMTSFLKKIGFADTSGNPTSRYTKFRNPSSSGQMVADAIRDAYAPLYIRNEYMHQLDDDELVGLIVEETGNAHDSNAVKLAARCITTLKDYADFDASNRDGRVEAATIANQSSKEPDKNTKAPPALNYTNSMGLNLGYTINLHLPPTTEVAVFDAIFESLKRNILTNDDV